MEQFIDFLRYGKRQSYQAYINIFLVFQGHALHFGTLFLKILLVGQLFRSVIKDYQHRYKMKWLIR